MKDKLKWRLTFSMKMNSWKVKRKLYIPASMLAQLSKDREKSYRYTLCRWMFLWAAWGRRSWWASLWITPAPADQVLSFTSGYFIPNLWHLMMEPWPNKHLWVNKALCVIGTSSAARWRLTKSEDCTGKVERRPASLQTLSFFAKRCVTVTDIWISD